MTKTRVKKSVLSPTDVTTLIHTMKVVFPTRDEVEKIVEEKLDAKIKLLPTKDEFFTRMDALSGEIKAVRQEQTIHADEHRKINDRFDRIDGHLHISTDE